MENEYTVKQVIFALREEYLKVRKELENLKKYMTIDSNIKESIIRFHKGIDEYIIILDLWKKTNIIQDAMLKLGIKPNDFYKYYSVYSEKSGTISSISQCPYVKITDYEGLTKDCQALLQNEFIKNTNITEYKVKNSDYGIASNEKRIYSIFWKPLGIDYDSIDDTFNVVRTKIGKFEITPDIIYNLLNLKVDNSNFNAYYKKVIENYPDKPLLVNGSQIIKHHGKYQILDEPKRLVLIPKNNHNN